MLAVSTALQMSLRAQQRYARLAARGEQVLNREEPSEEPPAWATFDEPVSVDELRKAALTQLDSLVDGGSADGSLDDLLGGRESGNGRSAGRMFEELFGVDDPAGGGDAAITGSTGSTAGTAKATDEATDATVTPITQAPGAAAKTGAAPRKSARKTSRKTATRKTATKSAPVKTAETTASTASTASAEKAQKAAPAKKTPRKAAPPPASETTDEPAKPVNKPRHTAPSKFDDADDS